MGLFESFLKLIDYSKQDLSRPLGFELINESVHSLQSHYKLKTLIQSRQYTSYGRKILGTWLSCEVKRNISVSSVFIDNRKLTDAGFGWMKDAHLDRAKRLGLKIDRSNKSSGLVYKNEKYLMLLSDKMIVVRDLRNQLD